jgi:hypothetical protein
MLAIVAVRLLQLKQQAKMAPDRLAGEVVSGEHVRMLAHYWKRPAATMTVYEFWRRTAMLGGFLGRKHDGEPGWQTLWKGWQKLDLMTLGVRAQVYTHLCYTGSGPQRIVAAGIRRNDIERHGWCGVAELR